MRRCGKLIEVSLFDSERWPAIGVCTRVLSAKQEARRKRVERKRWLGRHDRWSWKARHTYARGLIFVDGVLLAEAKDITWGPSR